MLNQIIACLCHHYSTVKKLPSHPFQDKKRRGFWAWLSPKKTVHSPPPQVTWPSPRVTIFHRGVATSLINRTEMEHLALPLTVKKIYSSLCACICGSWQGLPQPLFPGHRLNFDPWGWLYHSSLALFFSFPFLSYSFVSSLHPHTQAFFIFFIFIFASSSVVI